MTSENGEKLMSTRPPAKGITPSAVPWIASTEMGRAGWQGTSAALPEAVAMFPDTGAIAATLSASSQPARWVIIPPRDMPVTNTRPGSTPSRAISRSISARKNGTSSAPG